MHNRLGKALACATMAASTIGLFAAPSQAASTVPALPTYWNYGCDYGHACLRHRITVENSFWNVENCGDSGLHDYFNYAIAYGNGFTVYYQNGKWDYVAAWSQRTLDGTNLATMVRVYC
jgi:hypothetical protein